MSEAAVQVVELVIPRCSLRFGVGACEATGKTCHNTFATCLFKQAFNLDGSLTYRFTRQGDPVPRIYERDGEHIKTNAYPILQRVTSRATRINPGANRKGESPYGRRASGTIRLMDFTSTDGVGDFYGRDIEGSFAAMLVARLGEAQSQCEVLIYTGFQGQALGDMQMARFDVDAIEKTTQSRWQIRYLDPTRRVDRRRALFPRPTDIRLQQDIGATGNDILVLASLADLEDEFGNSDRQYVRFGSEIISYLGVTEIAAPIYSLDDVIRGDLRSTPDSHSVDDSGQRVGHYERERAYRVAIDLLENHTTFPNSAIPVAEWEREGGRFLSTIQVTGSVPEPTPVEDLLGELSRDGLFMTWYDERRQELPMIAVRPPQETPILITEADNLISIDVDREPDERLTQVWIRYGKRDPSNDNPTNFAETLVRVEPTLEGPFFADGTTRTKRIASRWIRTAANTRLVAASILLRYRTTPRYLGLELDKRDRHIAVGDVLDIETRETVDPDGQPDVLRWQVIEYKETVPGHRIQIVCQSYQYVGKFAIIMPNGTPNYADVPEADREFGCWLADDATGLMPDGTEPYLLQ